MMLNILKSKFTRVKKVNFKNVLSKKVLIKVSKKSQIGHCKPANHINSKLVQNSKLVFFIDTEKLFKTI